MPRIGLVLGAGGVVGHAFHAGVLAAIAETTGFDARDAELIVGTSAGSFVGALLRAGFSAPDLAARITGAPLTAEGADLLALAEAAHETVGPIPARPERRRGPAMASAPGAVARAALQPWKARLGAVAAALLPEGRVPTEVVVASLRPLFSQWPQAALWINAVELDSGRRVTFGRDSRYSIAVADAVAASCAIPSFFTPVVIDGRRYVDGGAHSLTNADLAAGLALDLVVVSSPMSIEGAGPRLAADQPARRLARIMVGREVARIRHEGTPVLVFQPTGPDLAAMGMNAMDDSARAPVTESVRASARERLESESATEPVSILAASVPAPPV